MSVEPVSDRPQMVSTRRAVDGEWRPQCVQSGVLTGAAGPGPSCSCSPQQVQLAGLMTSWQLWIGRMRGYHPYSEAPWCARPGLIRPPDLHHLTFYSGHLAADFSHLSFEADQHPRVRNRPPHHLRPPLSLFSRVWMRWGKLRRQSWKDKALFHREWTSLYLRIFKSAA